jgi:hypothetical protein
MQCVKRSGILEEREGEERRGREEEEKQGWERMGVYGERGEGENRFSMRRKVANRKRGRGKR